MKIGDIVIGEHYAVGRGWRVEQFEAVAIETVEVNLQRYSWQERKTRKERVVRLRHVAEGHEVTVKASRIEERWAPYNARHEGRADANRRADALFDGFWEALEKLGIEPGTDRRRLGPISRTLRVTTVTGADASFPRVHLALGETDAEKLLVALGKVDRVES